MTNDPIQAFWLKTKSSTELYLLVSTLADIYPSENYVKWLEKKKIPPTKDFITHPRIYSKCILSSIYQDSLQALRKIEQNTGVPFSFILHPAYMDRLDFKRH